MISGVGEKALRVLAVLLQNPRKLTSHDEIIEQVWCDNPSGVTPVHVAQYISKLRKFFAEYEPGKKFIENVKGRGYSFVGDVETKMSGTPPETSETPVASGELETSPVEQPLFRREAEEKQFKVIRPPTTFLKSRRVAVFLIPVTLLAVYLAWMLAPRDDEKEIRRVVGNRKSLNRWFYTATRKRSKKRSSANTGWLRRI